MGTVVVKMDSREKLQAQMARVPKRSQHEMQVSSRSGSHTTGGVSHIETIGEARTKITFPFAMTMLGLSLTLVIAQLTPLFLATCFTVIAYDLNAMDQAIWFTVSSYIAEGAIAPVVGSLSDLFGRRGIVLFSLGLKLAACILMGVTPNAGLFLFGQVLSGATSGIQELIAVAAATEVVPVSRRGIMVGYILIGFFPFAPAALYGRLLAAHSWRWNFLLLGILTAIAFILLAKWYKPPPRRAILGLTQKQLVARIDWVGFALSALGVTLFLVGLGWAGETYPWKSVQVVCSMFFGVVALLLFGAWEYWGTKYPMFPMRLFREKRLSAAVIMVSFMNGINYVPVSSFWRIQCYSVYAATWTQSAVYFLPLGFCIFSGALLGALLMTIFRNQIPWVLLCFCVVQMIGSATMAAVDRDDINTAWAPLIFALFGMGGLVIPVQIVFTIISPDDLIATNVALSVVIRMIGQTVGKSMFFNIMKTQLTKKAPTIIGILALGMGITEVDRIAALVSVFSAGPFSRYAALFPEIDTQQKMAAIVRAGHTLYAEVFPTIYLVTIPFGVLACIACVALWGVDQYMDDHVVVHL